MTIRSRSQAFSRRDFLSGKPVSGKGSGGYCVSSAVVTLVPGRAEEARERLGAMDGVEISASEGVRLVLILEGPTNGAVGGLLAEIAVMDGVLTANMVFEHSERRGA